MLWLDGGHTPVRTLLTIPEIVARHLQMAGVQDAEITTSERESLEEFRPIGRLGPCVTLRMFPDPPAIRVGRYSPVPSAWVDEAWSWLTRELPNVPHVTVRTLVPFQMESTAARIMLHDAHTSRLGEFIVLAGKPGERVASVQGYFGWGQLALAAADRLPLAEGDLFGSAERLKELARRLAPQLSYAYLGLEPYLGGQLAVFPYSSDNPRAGSLQGVSALLDELVFDVFPWQILGPGHVRRLGRTPIGGRELPAGRIELAVGDLEDWLPATSSRHTVRALAEGLLANCLVRGVEAIQIERTRWPRQHPST